MSNKKIIFQDYEITSYENFIEISKKDDIVLDVDITGCTIYFCACENGDIDFIKSIERDFEIDFSHKIKGGFDAYLWSAWSGQVDVMKYLEEKHNWNIKTKSSSGFNALFLAIDGEYINVIDYLIDTHNWNILEKDGKGLNALDWARSLSNKKIFKYLLKKLEKTNSGEKNGKRKANDIDNKLGKIPRK